MAVITISGVQFRIRPDVTIGHVLDVFRGFGRRGVIQKNGIVEYLDSPLDFSAADSYKFVDAADIFVENVQYQYGYLPFTKLDTTTEEASKTLVELPSETLVELPRQTVGNMMPLLQKTRATLLNQLEQGKTLLNQRGLLYNELPLTTQSRTTDSLSTGVLPPKFFQHVFLKAPEDNFLNLYQIEVLNMNEQNIVMNAALESNGIFVGYDAITRSYIQLVHDLTGLPLTKFRSALPGGWIRLGFNENKNDSISRVVLRAGERLSGTRLEIKKVFEYDTPTFDNSFKYNNLYPTDLINVIEIRAPTDRYLQLNQIVITNMMDRAVLDVMKFESSDLTATRKDLTAQELLFQKTNLNHDFIRSLNNGGFIRLTFAAPIPIQSVLLFGELHGVKVSMERHHSFMCSDELVQAFAL